MKLKEKILLILFTLSFFGTRIPGLDRDVINPDAVNWHYRSEQFVVGLKHRQFEKTYQHYHPGVTLMWATGIPIELFKQISGEEIYNHINFEYFHLTAKLSLIGIQLILTFLILYLLFKEYSYLFSFAAVSMFTFEPFFIGNSRLYHMDILFTLLIFVALLFGFKFYKKPTIQNSVLCGFFTSLVLLTRSLGILLIGFVIVSIFFRILFCEKPKKKVYIKLLLLFLLTGCLGTFILFPALWVKPVYYIKEIISEGERVGIRKGHDQILFGKEVTDGGVMFYPLVLLIKMSPLIWGGLLIYTAGTLINIKKILTELFKTSFVKRIKDINPDTFLAVFYISFFIAMVLPSKKLDRYMLVLFPFLAILSLQGYLMFFSAVKKLKNHKQIISGIITLLVLCFWVKPLVNIFPYYFTYTSPFVVNAQTANNIIGQKSFGVGVFELKNHILANYSNLTEESKYPNIGMIDTKPLKAIYPNSKVFDIRVNGVSDYDILVLTVNEEFPGEIINSKAEFVKDSSIYINGLEYWKIYVKRSN